MKTDTETKIDIIASDIAWYLKEKNLRYGDSALNPIHIFNKSSTSQSLYARADDKLSRIQNSETLRKNDVVDLIGYLVFICIANEWMDWGDQID